MSQVGMYHRDTDGELVMDVEKLKAPVIRWTPRLKERLVLAVRSDIISVTDLWKWHRVNETEFLEWARALRLAGREGLKVTKIQLRRDQYAG